MEPLDRAALLAAYDRELRAHLPDPLPGGWLLESDGPLLRISGSAPTGFVAYRDLDGLEGAPLDALIARQVAAFAARGEPFEWKLHEHDLPADLAGRLLRAGLVAGEPETVVIATAAAIPGESPLLEGLALSEVQERADLDRVATLEAAVWKDDQGWLVEMLEGERDADPESIAIVVAEARGLAVSAGWVRFVAGTEFATLWGGSTLPGWRRRGLYRALVARRARLARERGFRYLEVDALDGSRAILERMGFVAVTRTTPYLWRPQSAR